MGQALTLNRPDAKIYLYDAFKDELIDEHKLASKFGFPIARLPLYFSLLGDASDNIPGVRGIGKKGALEIAERFETLEQLYAQLDTISKPRIRNALEAHKKDAFLSRDLFLLRYTPTGKQIDQLRFNADDWIHAYALFKRLEFSSLISDKGLNKEQREKLLKKKIAHLKKYQFTTVTTSAQLNALAQELRAKKAYAIDTETDGLRPLEAGLVGISFCTQEGVAYYLPCGHKGDHDTQLSLTEIQTVLNPIFSDPAIKKYLHNAKFDMLVLENHGMPLAGVAFDSILAASLVTKDWQRVGLKHLSQFYFDEEMITFEDIVKNRKLKDFSYAPLDIATLYSAFDAHQTFRLTKLFEKKLVDEQMDRIFMI